MNDDFILLLVMVIYLGSIGLALTVPFILWGISYKVHEENRPLMANGLKTVQANWGTPIAVTATIGGIALILYIAYIVMMFVIQILSAVLTPMMTYSNSTSGIVVGLLVLFLIFAVMTVVQILLPLFVMGPTTAGLSSFFLAFTRGGDAPYSEMFSAFRDKMRLKRSAGSVFFIGLFYFLWYLLFIIPGIVALYSYALTFFIMADEPELTALEAITKSKEMMRGRKAQLFWLQHRFTGWGYLSGLTSGVGYLWLLPYQMTTFVNFYEEVKNAQSGNLSSIGIQN